MEFAMKKTIEVRPLNGYRVWLSYADGVSGEMDFGYSPGRGTIHFERALIQCQTVARSKNQRIERRTTVVDNDQPNLPVGEGETL